MKIKVWMTGKTSESWLREGMAVYEKRLVHYWPFSCEVLPDIRNAGSLDRAVLLQKEGEQVLKKLDKRDFLVLLDESGTAYRSVEFAAQLRKWSLQGVENLVFLVGGAFGFSQAVYERSHSRMSLSAMTFSHQMVRLIFLEQLYRAGTINKGEPYHHE